MKMIEFAVLLALGTKSLELRLGLVLGTAEITTPAILAFPMRPELNEVGIAFLEPFLNIASHD